MMDISQLGPDAQRQVLEQLTKKRRGAFNTPVLEVILQQGVEKALAERGYARRSPQGIVAEEPEMGWQVHIRRAKGNPIFLDIMLLGSDGRYLEFELKTKRGRWSSREQRILCTDHGKRVFCSVSDAIDYVAEWEEAAEWDAEDCELVIDVKGIRETEAMIGRGGESM